MCASKNYLNLRGLLLVQFMKSAVNNTCIAYTGETIKMI